MTLTASSLKPGSTASTTNLSRVTGSHQRSVSREAGRPPSTSVWRRNLRRYWVAAFLSEVGSDFSTLAFPLLVLVETGDALWVGVTGFALLAGRLVARLPAGYLIDRVDPKLALSICESVRCVLFLALSLVLMSGHFLLGLVVAVALLDGAGSALALPAERILVKTIAPRDFRSKAVAWMEARLHLVTLLAPPIGGLLFQVASWLPFAIDALTFGISAVLVYSLVIQRPQDHQHGHRSAGFLSGFRQLVAHPLLRSGATLAVGMNLLTQGMALALLVRAASAGAGAFMIGVMFSLGSLGGILGAAWAGRSSERIPWTSTLAIFGVTWAVGLTAATQTHNPIFLGCAFAIMAIPVPLTNTQMITALYADVPDDQLGRTSSSLGLLTGTISPLGPLLAGIISSRYGTDVLLVACLAILLGLLLASRLALGALSPGTDPDDSA